MLRTIRRALVGALLITLLGTSMAGASGLAGAYGSGGGFDPSMLSANVRMASLSDLYNWANSGQIGYATVNTTLDVVLFHRRGHSYATQFIGSTDAGLTRTLLGDKINVTISTASSLGNQGAGGSIWWPLGIAIFITLVALYTASFLHGRGDGRSLLPWKRWRVRARAGVGVHNAHNANHDDIPSTTFADVAGVDEAVASLAEIVEFLRDPERFERVGAVRPKGALMVGPPGTGKTLLARAVAGEAKVPFFSVSGSDFVEMFVGVGAKRVRELFARARKAKRAIVFIDEIDAVARKRSSGGYQGSDTERDGTLIALLNELDGFMGSEVIVLAATNRADILDPAIVRPGRLDRRVEVPNPDRRGRETILKVHAKGRPLASEVSLSDLARRTSGMSGADLANIVNEACIRAARRRASEVIPADFDGAVMTVMMGQARESALVSDEDRLITAWHEAGHTVCAFMQEAGGDPVSVSIVPRGAAGGVTAMGESDNNFLSRSRAGARLVSALGGRSCEEMLLGDDYTQGAHGDLQVATDLATLMVSKFGMNGVDLVTSDDRHPGDQPDAVRLGVGALLSRAQHEARRILEANRGFVELLVEALLSEDTLMREDIERAYKAAGSPDKIAPRATLEAMYDLNGAL